MRYVPRAAGGRIRALLKTFPAVLVYGPRQCGKSTLVQNLYPDWHHVDLERPSDLQSVAADIEGFLDAHPRRLVIDEAQRLPDLFPALRHAIDRRPERGRFLLLGSASPSLLRAASEGLAGRLALLELSPFTARELVGRRHFHDRWFWGGYPPVARLRGQAARTAWLDAYVGTFLERDIPSFGYRLTAQRLRLLWTMLTHVHGNLLNASDLARSLGVSVPTVQSHLDALESTFMVRRLPPFFANVQKRLTKSPKIYIRDTGLLHFLAGLRASPELSTWSRRGASFEGLVIEEIAALANERFVRPELFFWRTQAGAEVDLLVVAGRRIVPIEIKLGTSVDAYGVAGLRRCLADLGLSRGWVVCGTRRRYTIGRNVEVVPWSEVASGRADFLG